MFKASFGFSLTAIGFSGLILYEAIRVAYQATNYDISYLTRMLLSIQASYFDPRGVSASFGVLNWLVDNESSSAGLVLTLLLLDLSLTLLLLDLSFFYWTCLNLVLVLDLRFNIIKNHWNLVLDVRFNIIKNQESLDVDGVTMDDLFYFL